MNSYLRGSGETAGFAKSCSLVTGQPTEKGYSEDQGIIDWHKCSCTAIKKYESLFGTLSIPMQHLCIYSRTEMSQSSIISNSFLKN